MDIARSRSPPAGRRPIGPRSPGKPGTLTVKNTIPLDLTARLQEDLAGVPRTASPEHIDGPSQSGSSSPPSPASAPLPSRSNTIRSESSANGHVRTESHQSYQSHQSHQSHQSQLSHNSQSSQQHKEDAPPAHEDTTAGDAVLAGEPTETEDPKDGETAAAATRRTSASPVPPTDLASPTEEEDSGQMNILNGLDVAGAHDTAGARAERTGAAVPDSPTLAAGHLSLPPRPPHEAGAVSPTDSISTDILDMYMPASPSSPTVPTRDDTVPPALRPPSLQVNGSNEAAGLNETESPYDTSATPKLANGVNGVLGVNGTDGNHDRSLSEKSVQASIAIPERSSTPASTRSSTPALLKVVPRRPPLSPPTAISFETEPIQWKAMTLEAAQWTFTSEQLQETVSRAIRQSAAESFIRVVSTHTYDVELPQELERLETLRTTTQAQYRFNMHRRAMLLQSLAALSQSQTDSDGEALYNLTTQLTDLTSSCDRLLETLTRIADQKTQIQHVQDLHIASALAMALRKLNTSYAKRTAELQETRSRNEELRAELEEAWNMAQDMAQEMDDLDNFDLAFSDEEFTPVDDDEPSTSALEAEIYNDMDRMSAVSSMRHAEVVEITGKAVVTKAVVTNLAGAPPKPGDRTSRVFAAKKRSDRASKASLRIPRTPKTPTAGNGERPDRSSIYSIRSMRSRRSRSKSVRRTERGEDSKQVPDVPIIRLPEPSKSQQGSNSREGSFLELVHTRPGSPAGAGDVPPPLPPKEENEEKLGMNLAAATLSEVVLPQSTSFDSESTQQSSPTSLNTIPTINYPDQEGQPRPSKGSWAARRFFARRVHSMQPAIRAADDATNPAQIKRAASESKQFDGWPFLSTSKAQRFSVPVLSAIPLRGRKSSDSAPPESSS